MLGWGWMLMACGAGHLQDTVSVFARHGDPYRIDGGGIIYAGYRLTEPAGPTGPLKVAEQRFEHEIHAVLRCPEDWIFRFGHAAVAAKTFGGSVQLLGASDAIWYVDGEHLIAWDDGGRLFVGPCPSVPSQPVEPVPGEPVVDFAVTEQGWFAHVSPGRWMRSVDRGLRWAEVSGPVGMTPDRGRTRLEDPADEDRIQQALIRASPAERFYALKPQAGRFRVSRTRVIEPDMYEFDTPAKVQDGERRFTLPKRETDARCDAYPWNHDRVKYFQDCGSEIRFVRGRNRVWGPRLPDGNVVVRRTTCEPPHEPGVCVNRDGQRTSHIAPAGATLVRNVGPSGVAVVALQSGGLAVWQLGEPTLMPLFGRDEVPEGALRGDGNGLRVGTSGRVWGRVYNEDTPGPAVWFADPPSFTVHHVALPQRTRRVGHAPASNLLVATGRHAGDVWVLRAPAPRLVWEPLRMPVIGERHALEFEPDEPPGPGDGWLQCDDWGCGSGHYWVEPSGLRPLPVLVDPFILKREPQRELALHCALGPPAPSETSLFGARTLPDVLRAHRTFRGRPHRGLGVLCRRDPRGRPG